MAGLSDQMLDLISNQPLRALRGECEWGPEQTELWKAVLNPEWNERRHEFASAISELLKTLSPGPLRGLLWIGIQAHASACVAPALPAGEDGQARQKDLAGCSPGSGPHTLLCWALLEHPDPQTRAAAQRVALSTDLTSAPQEHGVGSWQRHRTWHAILVAAQNALLPDTLIWLARHSPTSWRLRFELIVVNPKRVRELAPNVQAAREHMGRDLLIHSMYVRDHVANAQSERWQELQLNLISEPVPRPRRSLLRPYELDWLWCWHELAPLLKDEARAQRSPLYPLAAVPQYPPNRQDSESSNLLLLIWPHETRSLSHEPQPPELWLELQQRARLCARNEDASMTFRDRPELWRPIWWRALLVWATWTWPMPRPHLRRVADSLKRLNWQLLSTQKTQR